MQKNDLVSEIEEAVEKLVDIYEEDDPKCDFGVYRMRTAKVLGDTISTLQRAREALAWIPVSERLPEETDWYEITWEGSARDPIRQCLLFVKGYWYDSEDDSHEGQTYSVQGVIAWREPSLPYTPEEK